jgi:hypothetical protein
MLMPEFIIICTIATPNTREIVIGKAASPSSRRLWPTSLYAETEAEKRRYRNGEKRQGTRG